MLATSFRCRISTALKRACARARESQRSFENLRTSEHLRRQTSVTTTGPQLPPPHTPQPPAPAHSLNQPVTLAEIEAGLQHLRNGRSGALHGYTSELLRYAQLVATPDDPAPAHLLAPCLVVLFNAAFRTGQVPSPGRPPWSPQFSSMAMPQTQPTIGQSQWVSQSAGYTPVSSYSALSHTQSSSSCGLPPDRLPARAWHRPSCLRPSACC